jgi:hypothetical protein
MIFIIALSCQKRPTKRAPDGWDSARFLELVRNDGSFPFRKLVFPSRTPQGHNTGRWAAEGLRCAIIGIT